MSQLWRGSGRPESAARGFCRNALMRQAVERDEPLMVVGCRSSYPPGPLPVPEEWARQRSEVLLILLPGTGQLSGGGALGLPDKRRALLGKRSLLGLSRSRPSRKQLGAPHGELRHATLAGARLSMRYAAPFKTESCASSRASE